MSTGTWVSAFETRLVASERLLAVVENLRFSLMFVPHANPTGNYEPDLAGALALTTHRLIAGWAEGQGWKFYNAPALNGFSERRLRPDKRRWPYQAIVMLPGGMSLIVQTSRADAEHGNQLRVLLTQALIVLGKRDADDGALAAIVAYEEQKRREEEQRRRDD
jgi:hypothetical protein